MNIDCLFAYATIRNIFFLFKWRSEYRTGDMTSADDNNDDDIPNMVNAPLGEETT